MSRIEQLNPHGWVADIAQAEFDLHNNAINEAIKALEKAVEISPSTGSIYIDLGNAYFRQGSYNKARESFQNALKCLLPKSDADHALQGIEYINGISKAHLDAAHEKEGGVRP